MGLDGPVAVEQAASAALAGARPEDVVCVAGSMYLVGNVRSRWHPVREIIAEGNSWPGRPAI